LTALCTVRSCVVLSGVCMVVLYGRGCTGGSNPFLEFRGTCTGVCIRTGTVQISTEPIRYGANRGLCYAGVIASYNVRGAVTVRYAMLLTVRDYTVLLVRVGLAVEALRD